MIRRMLRLISVFSRSKIKPNVIHPNQRLSIYESIKQKQPSSTIYDNKYKCDGCNTVLQTNDTSKYGYINPSKLESSLKHNQDYIKDSYKLRMKEQAIKDIIHQVERETGVNIINDNQQLQNLDDLNVLVRLQQKMDAYEAEEQFLIRNKNNRKQILCFRCYNIKFYNRIPQQYDKDEFYSHNTFDYVVNKVLNKHKGQDVEYLYLVDVFDLKGTFQYDLFAKIANKGNLNVIVNKLDIVNERYLNKELIYKTVNQMVQQFNKRLGLEKPKKIPVFFTCSTSKPGIKKLREHLLKIKPKRIQLIGYPNTGKTTLLNNLAKLSRPTSKIPGTTIHITDHLYNTSQRIFDMPGLYAPHLLYNLISKPTLKSILTWSKFYSPATLIHSAIFFGGKVQMYGARIIIFGLGGACTANNKWFLLNYNQFWKGLPDLNQLNITKYQIEMKFINGKTDDLQIQGYGFIGFRTSNKIPKEQKKLILYLPAIVKFHFRPSVLSDDPVIYTVQSNQFMLERLKQKKQQKKQQKTQQKADLL